MTSNELIVKMVMDRWNGSIVNFNKILNSFTDKQLLHEVAPGKNRGTYLLGHLVAVHDDMLRLLDMGEKMYPQLQEPFIKLADKVASDVPPASELRTLWHKQYEVLNEKFEQMNAEQWFEKHTAASEEDFVKEPYRNKLNIIITRTSHLQYHSGQFVLLT